MDRNYYLKINRKIYYVPSLTPEEFVKLTGQPIENYYKITGKRPPRAKKSEESPDPDKATGAKKIRSGRNSGKSEKKSSKKGQTREDN